MTDLLYVTVKIKAVYDISELKQSLKAVSSLTNNDHKKL